MHHTRAAGALERLLSAIPPASGAVVMGTGIVSIALSLDHQETLSRILLGVAAVTWIALGVLLAARVLRDRERVHQEARSPAALTGVAGSAVLGTRLTLLGWSWAGIALLVIALSFWLVLLTPVLTHWVTPTIGVSLILTVSTRPLAVLSAALAALRPRLRYPVRRWSTVFPLGMYAACSFVVGALATATAITDFARVWVWVSAAVWVAVFAAMLRRGLQLARGEQPPLHSRSRSERAAPR